MVEGEEAAGIGRFTDDNEFADESSGKDEEEPGGDSDWLEEFNDEPGEFDDEPCGRGETSPEVGE